MDFLETYAIYIIIFLLVIIAILAIILYIQYNEKKEVVDDRDAYRSEYHRKKKESNDLRYKCFQLEDSLKQTCVELSKLQQNTKVSKPKHNNEKRGKQSDASIPRSSVENKPQSTCQKQTPVEPSAVPSSIETKTDPASSENQIGEVSIESKDASIETKHEKAPTTDEPKKVAYMESIMYSSFPRSAGDSIYFSDLTNNLVDDSYFELKITEYLGKATFKPLNFMKIRNYDSAMAAMQTEGVKPNVASTVLGIEPGEAHIDGKDWIIDKPAKIKLA